MDFRIEKWVYGGEGLARMPADESGRGKAVFIPFVLPGEDVVADIFEERSGFARAKLTEVNSPSNARVQPPCPYFYRCGGCQYQHADYIRQVELKRDILVETLQRTAKLKPEGEVQLHSAAPYQYRNRTRLKIEAEPEFAIGYHRFASNVVLPVRECPISSPLINRAIAAIWGVGGEVSANGLREAQFFANHDDSELLAEFYVAPGANTQALKSFAEAFRAEVPEIAGVAIFPRALTSDDEERPEEVFAKSAGEKHTIGADSLTYRIAHGSFRVSAGSFFQTNRFLIDELVAAAIPETGGRTALDLYAGTGLFSVPLATGFDRVIAVEASPFSFADLQHNAPPNVKPVQATTQKYLENVGRKPGLDFVLLDPPRSGMGERTARLLGQTQVARITYVSCDPATLARDLRVLAGAGFRLQSLHLVDLFPQTFHMETIVHLVR